MPLLALLVVVVASCVMPLGTSAGDSSLELHVGRIGVLESIVKSFKGAGVDVVIAVIEHEDALHEETRPCNVFFQNSY